MTLTDAGNELKRFRVQPGNQQQTYATPLKDLPRFVAAILTSVERLDSASVLLQSTVFEPRNLCAFLAGHGIETKPCSGHAIQVTGRDEIAQLLEAALADWIDFAFVPSPRSFALYADHDEYTTIYAATTGKLHRITATLDNAGYRTISDYRRPL